jgi:hypothetical protein
MSLYKLFSDWKQAGCNYESGRLLFDNYGKSNFVKRVLAKGDNRSNRELLLKELTALCKSEVQVPGPDPVQLFEPVPRAPRSEPYEVLSLPPSLQEKHYNKGKLHKEAGALRERLRYEPNNEKRRDLIEQMMTVLKKRDALWLDLTYYNNHKSERPESKIADVALETMSIADLVKLEKRLAPAVSRLKNKLPTLSGADLERETAKYESHKARLDQVRALLRS